MIAHVLFRAGSLDRGTFDSVLEARRVMLAEAGRMAAERRSAEQAAELLALADRLGQAAAPDEAQALDFAFFDVVVDASANVVFKLVMNSIRELYFGRAELFEAVVVREPDFVRLYGRAAAAIEAGSGSRAAKAIAELAGAQEKRLAEALA